MEAFARSGLPATRVRTAKTGVREAWVLARVLGRVGADAILVDRPRDLRLAALASLVRPLAIVNRYNLSRPRPPRDLLTRMAYRRVRLTIFASRTTADRALALAPYLRRRPHRVIHGCVDSRLFHHDAAAAEAFRRDHGLGDARFALAVGSLTLDKGYDFLIDAWRMLLPGAPMLVICGEGSHGPRLRRRADEMGLNLRFLGHQPPERLRAAYSAATCFVHAGAVETFGLSVLEAMACGCAVVAIRGGAVPEVVGDAGLLADSGPPAEFAALVRAVLEGGERRIELGQAARRRATERFSAAAMHDAYATAIAEACGCASSS